MKIRDIVVESRDADAKQVLDYIHGTHHESLTTQLQQAVLSHPRWELKTVPLSSLHIPDQEYDDEDQEPEEDPYNRVQAIDPDHAGEYSANFVDRRPIVVDADGWIIDGNHRAWAAAELLNRSTIQAWVPASQLNELGNAPAEYKPNRRRKRSLFHATVDNHWVDVFFDRSEFNDTLHITFAVNGNYDAPEKATGASKSTVRILSTVLNIIKKQLPEYMAKARPPAVSFTSKQDNRTTLYRRYFVPVIQDILGPKWQHEEYTSMGMTVFHWRPEKKQNVQEESVNPANTLYFFDVAKGGRSFDHLDLRIMGLKQSQKGRWYWQPGRDSTDLLTTATLKHLEKTLNVPARAWTKPVTESRIIDTERVDVYYRPVPGSRGRRVVAQNIPAAALEPLLQKLSEKYAVPVESFEWTPSEPITEAFDQPYAIQWRKQNGDWHATADLDDGSELIVLFMAQGNNNWMVEFERDENMEITGEGDAPRVFATVLTAMRQFIAKRKPVMLNFSAEKEDDPTGSRARLYDRMLRRYITGTGYDLTRKDVPGGATYTLTKQAPGVAEGLDDNGISFQVQKGKNKFATTLSMGNNPVGVYQYNATTGRSIAEVYPEFKGKGLGKLLVLHAIYTATQLGLDFQEDESRTSEYDNVLDSLSSNGYIVDDDGYWYVTGEGEQYLKQSLKQGVAEGKIKLYTDPGYFGAEVDDAGFDSLPVVNISADRLVGFEPDSKMNQPKSQANVKKIVAGLKKGDKLPPLLVRKYKNGYQVLDGHHRFWAYKLSGTKSIPVRIVADQDIEEISKSGVAEGESNTMANTASRLANKDDGKVAKLRVAGDKRREEQLKGRDIAKRDRTSKDEWDDLLPVVAEGVYRGDWVRHPDNPWQIGQIQSIDNGQAAVIWKKTDKRKKAMSSTHAVDALQHARREFSQLTQPTHTPGMAEDESLDENFADGKNPGRKGLSKRMGVNTKASVSSLRKTAKHSTGEKQRMAHWLANMKAGRAKARKK